MGVDAATQARALWHPFGDMNVVSRREFEIERGEGPWVWDVEGERYLDACSSMWYANLGHGREEVIEAVAAQLRRLDAYTIFNDYGNPPANALANRLAELAPLEQPKVWLGSGGGDAIEAAAKIARAHWIGQGRPEKLHLIGRRNSYHGVHGIGTSLGGISSNRDGWGPLMEQISLVPHDSVEALEEEVKKVGSDNVAAFLCEPVIGSGGVLLPSDGYLEGVAEVCDRYDVLFVVDAVICGFGRLGTWFGIERWDVQPDLICFAKGVTAGYLPMGGVIVARHIAAPYWETTDGHMLRHGVTYAGHPACCAAALATLDIYESEGLIPRGKELERALSDVLTPLAEHPSVSEVRSGLGLLGAVELTSEVLDSHPEAVTELLHSVRAAGVIVRPSMRSVAVAPPLTIEEDQLQLIGDAIAEGLKVFERQAVAGHR